MKGCILSVSEEVGRNYNVIKTHVQQFVSPNFADSVNLSLLTQWNIVLAEETSDIVKQQIYAWDLFM